MLRTAEVRDSVGHTARGACDWLLAARSGRAVWQSPPVTAWLRTRGLRRARHVPVREGPHGRPGSGMDSSRARLPPIAMTCSFALRAAQPSNEHSPELRSQPSDPLSPTASFCSCQMPEQEMWLKAESEVLKVSCRYAAIVSMPLARVEGRGR